MSEGLLFLTEADVRALLPMPEAVSLMREVFTGLATEAAVNQVRRRLLTPEGCMLHQLAGRFGKYYGAKIYSTHVKHGAWFLVMLYDAATAHPLCLLEANHLGQIRTGAASGFATDVMARPGQAVLGVIGSGFQARTQVEAVMAVRPLREVLVYSRKEDRRREFARALTGELGVSARATDTAEQAVRQADIVVTATFAKDPVLEDSWVKPGTHVNAIGSNQPSRRELPGELVKRAARIAVDSLEQSRIEAGDLLLGLDDWSRVEELQHFAQWGPRDPDAITVFKSNGLGVEDIASAGHIYEKALSSGRGTRLPLFAER